MKILNVKDQRSKLLLKNIGYTGLYRFLGIAINFLSVPLLIKILGIENYGLWITLSSILMWFNFFDLGVNNSLRNKITETISNGKTNDTQQIISTTYFVTSSFTLISIVLIVILSTLFDWSKILNTTKIARSTIEYCIILIGISISLQITLKLVSAVLFAQQKTRISELINTSIQFLTLIFLFLIYHYSEKNHQLASIATLFSIIPILVLLAFNYIVFFVWYKDIVPNFKQIRFNRIKDLLSTSSNFFILQLYGLVLLQTDNFVVSNLFNPAAVTTFGLTTKYFAVITTLFGVILTPVWAATTEAISLGDFKWVSNSKKRNLSLLLLMLLPVAVMIVFSNPIIQLWSQSDIKIPLDLSILIAFFTMVQCYNSIQGLILHAANIFRLQVISSVIIIIINVPLAYLLASTLGYGLNGVVMANLICIVGFGIITTLQVSRFLNLRLN